jgi:TatD DNase family protein
MSGRLIDTHCHLQDRAFAGEVDAVIERALAAGVEDMVDCGYDASSNAGVLELAERVPAVHPAVGFHPHDAKDATESLLRDLESQARTPGVVAIGEIGLDFYRDHSPHDVQRRVLDRQLEIAVRLALPVSIHSRSAEAVIQEQLDVYAAASPLVAQRRPVGVMHCFAGTVEQAQHLVRHGFLVSIACVITYPRNDAARLLATELPLDSLVVETDSPYLPPQMIRGKRNEPAMVRAAVEAIAAARGVSINEVAAATSRNAARLFGLSLAPRPHQAVHA